MNLLTRASLLALAKSIYYIDVFPSTTTTTTTTFLLFLLLLIFSYQTSLKGQTQAKIGKLK